jgi:uncharacterized protein involved in exopolysaccharide biosynthesis
MSSVDANLRIDGDADLRVLAAMFWAGRWWILVSMTLFVVAWAVAALLMTPIYRATAVLVPARVEGGMGSLGSALGQFGGLAALAGMELGSTDSSTDEALAVLQSRELTERFIVENDLLPKFFSRRWDADARRWKGGVDEQPTLAQGHKYFDRRVRVVRQDAKTGLIRVQIEWRDPIEAALWANELVALVNAEMRARAIAQSNASVGYLEKELQATTIVATKEAIGRLMETQITQRMLANVTHEYAFRVVDKALPPDADDIAKPNKVVMVVMGAAMGFLIGVVAVFLLRRRSYLRSAA